MLKIILDIEGGDELYTLNCKCTENVQCKENTVLTVQRHKFQQKYFINLSFNQYFVLFHILTVL